MKHLLLLLVVIMSGCGVLMPSQEKKDARKAERHLRKAKKHERLAFAYGAVIYPDTVYKSVEVSIPSIEVDTVVNVVNWHDTITVVKDRVTTRVVVTPNDRTVYIASKCDSVIITKEVPVTVTKRIEVPVTKEKKAMFIFIGILTGMGITFLLIWLIGRLRNSKS